MSTVPKGRVRPGRLLLRGVSWPEYSRFLRAFAERPGVRLTYDRGTLEIMSPLPEHERPADMLGRFVMILTEELALPAVAGASMTLRRRRHRRGLEPDRCWWIAGAPQLQGRVHIDLRRDPPPDLAVEVDVTSSSLNRMGIYAALGVPEVWRLDAQGLSFHALHGQAYRPQTHSRSFPQITPADLAGFLAQIGQVDDTTLGLRFRAWLRQRLAPPPAPQP
jgi:Uma2 family endonuclease